MKILGISAFYHDSAAALICDGDIVAAAQEERFTRRKHDESFPEHAIAYCLKQGDLTLGDVDYVVFYEKPLLKLERLLETYLTFAPKGFPSFSRALPVWLKEKIFQKDLMIKTLKTLDPAYTGENILFSEHHMGHAASAYYPSPFDEAIVLTMDGVGEWATTTMGVGKGNKLEIIKEINFPHSLGLLYSAITYYLGFKVNSGEYKIMGLAPYGEPKYADLMKEHLIDIKDDGSFRLDMTYFDYCTNLTMTNKKFDRLFGAPPRKAETELSQRDMDLAASVQAVTEEIVLKMTRALAQEYRIKNLCLAGGVALNCVANGKALRQKDFDNIWIQPAAGDAGGALGAAYDVYYQFCDARERKQDKTATKTDHMHGAYLGPSYEQDEIEARLKACGAVFEVKPFDEVIATSAQALADEKALGWFQGRMEFGPRALGGRSIIGDARSPRMQKQLNLKVKYRESFRPFAPSVLREHVKDWFDLDTDSPYMLLVADVADDKQVKMTAEEEQLFGIDKLNIKRSEIPAVTHVDYSARIQTVHKETNPAYHALISRFNELTKCPVIVNTSFNVRGEPIVCTPEDAFHCFMGTELDMLVVGNCLLYKDQQDERLKKDYKNEFELD